MTKEECIGREYLKFQARLKRIEEMFTAMYEHRIKQVGDDTVFYNGVDHVKAICTFIDFSNYDIEVTTYNPNDGGTYSILDTKD